MSNTDIVPPRSFSTIGEKQTLRSNWNSIQNVWGPWLTSVTFNQDLSGVEARNSYVTANYIEACNTGTLGENAFLYTRNQDRQFSGYLHTKTSGPSSQIRIERGTFTASFCSVPSVNSISVLRRSNLDNEAKQKLFDKVRDSDINIAVAYGERAETIRMLTGTIQKLGKVYSQAKSGNWLGAFQALGGSGNRPAPSFGKSVANNWLELQYGWLPLMSDIFGACATLQKQVSRKQYVVVRARKKIQDTGSSEATSGNFVDYTTVSAMYEVSVRAKMRLSNMGLKTATEVGLTNPALVAWELVPFSFVVDWALPIGSFLSQFDASLGWEFSVGSITRFYRCEAIKSRRPIAGPIPGYDYIKCEGQCSAETLSVTRSGINSWVELLSLPVIKDPGSVTHCLNALALLTSRR